MFMENILPDLNSVYLVIILRYIIYLDAIAASDTLI